MRHDRLGGGDHGAQIGALVRQDGRRDGDQEGIRRPRLPGDPQVAGGQRSVHQRAQPRFLDVQLTLAQPGDDALVDIDARHLQAAVGEGAGRRQADVAEPQDTHVAETHGLSPETAIMPYPAKRARRADPPRT